MPGTRGVDDYPEHLNPFHEEDNHNFLKFWKNTKKKVRSNSFSQGFKDLRNNIAFRSMARRKKGSTTSSGEEENKSPLVLRRNEVERAQQIKTERSTLDVPFSTNRYVYQGSVTPLPRSRFQSTSENSSPVTIRSRDRFDPSVTSTPNKSTNNFRDHRSTAPFALPGLTRGPFRDSRRTSESTNPFDHDDDDDVVTPTYNQNTLPNIKKSTSFNNKMGTYPRKKRRAPLPPSVVSNSEDIKTDTPKEILIASDPVFATELRIDEDEKSAISNQNEQSQDSGIELNMTADTNQTVSSLEHENAGSSTTIDKSSDDVQWVSNELYEISSDKKEKDKSLDLDNVVSEIDKEDANAKTDNCVTNDTITNIENGYQESNHSNQIIETTEEVELKIDENIGETEKAIEVPVKTESEDTEDLASKVIENNDQNKYQDSKEAEENKYIEQAEDVVEINENKEIDTKDDSNNNNNTVTSSVRNRIAKLEAEQQNGCEESKKKTYKNEVNGSPNSISSGEVDIHSPNPIPKPRRSKFFSTSSNNSNEQ